MSEELPQASFVSFYSFKGGVGRSMALINTAGILAGRRGFRVLVIDLDLEAPGLSYLNPGMPDVSPAQTQRELPFKDGFVELLSDAKKRGQEADLFALTAADIADRYTQEIRLPEDLREFKDGSLHIMSAGRFDDGYPQRFDSLDLGGLYREGLGEPLIRAFKKKLGEAGLYDYVLVDSRTGFSDEAGICTRDLADHLMILSGLNRQNVEGTCAFLRALRSATDGKKTFQIILSPVPNGEDALFEQREAAAKDAFKTAWGGDVDVSLQIPYHPQLALTEEPHIFRSRRGHLFHAYCAIETSMLDQLGHNVQSFRKRFMQSLGEKNYLEALHELRHMIRLDRGKFALSRVADDLMLSRPLRRKAEAEPTQEEITLDNLLRDDNGRRVVEFIVDWLPLGERDWGSRRLLSELRGSSPELADRLSKRMVAAAPNDADILGDYANFIADERGDFDAAETYYKRAIDVNPKDANHLGNYAIFLAYQRGNLDTAESYYKRAIEADPKNARNLGNYANFLASQRGNLDTAESYYKRAIEADPKNARNLGNYAFFLSNERGDFDTAQSYYKRAVEADPKDARNLGNYAKFLANQRGDLDVAEIYYKRAIETDPEKANNLGIYANFLARKREDLDTAEIYYKRSIEADPENANNLGNYGQLLAGRERLKEAEERLLGAFKHCDQSESGDLAELCFSLWLVIRMEARDASRWERQFKFLIQQGFKRSPWSFDRMLDQAAKILSADEFHYAKALASAFLDETKLPDLNEIDRWRAVEPLDPIASTDSLMS